MSQFEYGVVTSFSGRRGQGLFVIMTKEGTLTDVELTFTRGEGRWAQAKGGQIILATTLFGKHHVLPMPREGQRILFIPNPSAPGALEWVHRDNLELAQQWQHVKPLRVRKTVRDAKGPKEDTVTWRGTITDLHEVKRYFPQREVRLPNGDTITYFFEVLTHHFVEGDASSGYYDWQSAEDFLRAG